ncbi:hypothetical protein SV7mr_11230 [Stieleria bergensis]|uniref:DUF58 domain-containing protein n=1 Tax=Stieleria bergensis TaxID=2528025 RepID=A0A517SR77_9BACT|nr:hypothetical protein SV7mr_11230 [Planctomycetes bacterium SV_7m_r]
MSVPASRTPTDRHSTGQSGQRKLESDAAGNGAQSHVADQRVDQAAQPTTGGVPLHGASAPAATAVTGSRVSVSSEVTPVDRQPFAPRWMILPLRFLVRWVVWIITLPIRSYLVLRRALTSSSVVALLAIFAGLNVIWGFPWVGILGACLSIMVVGYALSLLFAPRFKVGVSLPRSARVGVPFSVGVLLTNRFALPAFSLRLGFHNEGVREIVTAADDGLWDASESLSANMVQAGDQVRWNGMLCYSRRGVFQLPRFRVTSSFPFFLFHLRKQYDLQTQIAITPAPLQRDQRAVDDAVMEAIGSWAQRLTNGVQLEYLGSREYQDGVAVRRWDFASWARLGRPIVREFQAPSVQSVVLIVDVAKHQLKPSGTTVRTRRRERQEQAATFEFLMSAAASTIDELTLRNIDLVCYCTDRESTTHSQKQGRMVSGSTEDMLIHLASADSVDLELANDRIEKLIAANPASPVLILSLVDHEEPKRTGLLQQFPARVHYLPLIDQAMQSVAGGAS